MDEGRGLTNASPLLEAGGCGLSAGKGGRRCWRNISSQAVVLEQQRMDNTAVRLGAGGETGLSVPAVSLRGPRGVPPPLAGRSWAARQSRSIPKAQPGRSTGQTGPQSSPPGLQAASIVLSHPLLAQNLPSSSALRNLQAPVSPPGVMNGFLRLWVLPGHAPAWAAASPLAASPLLLLLHWIPAAAALQTQETGVSSSTNRK